MEEDALKNSLLSDTVTSTLTGIKEAPSITASSVPHYKRILVPDDNSELSDKALSYAVYLSNSTGAEIVILNVVKHIDKIELTTISATTTEDKDGKAIVEYTKSRTDKNKEDI